METDDIIRFEDNELNDYILSFGCYVYEDMDISGYLAYDLDEVKDCKENMWFPDPRFRAYALPFDFEGIDVRKADDDNVIPLCVGGDLSSRRLLLAYSFGIFPWFDHHSPYPFWYAPVKRFVLFPDEIHISHSMRTLLNKNLYRVTVNQAFPEVIEACRTVDGRSDHPNAWLGEDIVKAYTGLWREGYVKSVEVWDNETGRLAGGLYGVWLNCCFMGESMFSHVPSGSKIALVGLCEWMRDNRGKVIDLQIKTDHLESMGGRYISYLEYLGMLNPKAAEAGRGRLLDISYRNGNQVPEP